MFLVSLQTLQNISAKGWCYLEETSTCLLITISIILFHHIMSFTINWKPSITYTMTPSTLAALSFQIATTEQLPVDSFDIGERKLRQCLSVKHAWACNFTKSSTSPWVLFTVFNLYKWYHIAQSISYLKLIWNEQPMK